jgi:hypothetical protein
MGVVVGQRRGAHLLCGDGKCAEAHEWIGVAGGVEWREVRKWQVASDEWREKAGAVGANCLIRGVRRGQKRLSLVEKRRRACLRHTGSCTPSGVYPRRVFCGKSAQVFEKARDSVLWRAKEWGTD